MPTRDLNLSKFQMNNVLCLICGKSSMNYVQISQFIFSMLRIFIINCPFTRFSSVLYFTECFDSKIRLNNNVCGNGIFVSIKCSINIAFVYLCIEINHRCSLKFANNRTKSTHKWFTRAYTFIKSLWLYLMVGA